MSEVANVSQLNTWLSHDQGFSVTTLHQQSNAIKLTDFDQVLWLGNKLPSPLKPIELVRLVERGGNLVWAQAAGGRLERSLVELGRHFGLQLQPRPGLIHDELSDSLPPTNGDGDEGLVWGECKLVHLLSIDPVLSDQKTQPPPRNLPFKGHAMTLDAANPLVFPLLTAASDTAYTHCGDEEGAEGCVPMLGREQVLAAALQARNGARVTVIGGMGQWGNRRWSGEGAAEWRTLLHWALGGSRRLHLDSLRLLLSNADRPEGVQVIRDPFRVQACLREQVRLAGGATVEQAYLAKDVQVELSLMEPVFRLTLKPNPLSGCLESEPGLRLPARYGVYRLSLRYQRPGWTHLVSSQSITIRPARYEDDPRWVGLAMPYHLTWLLIVFVSLFILLPFWLVHERLGRKQKQQ